MKVNQSHATVKALQIITAVKDINTVLAAKKIKTVIVFLASARRS